MKRKRRPLRLKPLLETFKKIGGYRLNENARDTVINQYKIDFPEFQTLPAEAFELIVALTDRKNSGEFPEYHDNTVLGHAYRNFNDFVEEMEMMAYPITSARPADPVAVKMAREFLNYTR